MRLSSAVTQARLGRIMVSFNSRGPEREPEQMGDGPISLTTTCRTATQHDKATLSLTLDSPAHETACTFFKKWHRQARPHTHKDIHVTQQHFYSASATPNNTSPDLFWNRKGVLCNRTTFTIVYLSDSVHNQELSVSYFTARPTQPVINADAEMMHSQSRCQDS